MADTMIFELVTPEKLLASAETDGIVIPATEGEMTVMPDHAPTMTTIRPGVVKFKNREGKEFQFLVFHGFADVQGNACTLLAETAVPIGEAADAIEHRIKTLRKELDDASHSDHKSAIEQMMNELTHLNQTVLPG
ncbi:F0F1 ATP synthase subunit epsilon [Martelella mangrovi]|uniref:ATP synthase epsilon chain n=1 Tax=Martelella mangrovi TaxID=1397477 RepID=A0ABV2IEI0_9HYPH|nr:F0F1 ATP synthase subunit epsilon [uncultured Martelella sp.]